MNNPLAGIDPTGYTGCAASRIESACESLGSSFGGYDTNYGAEAQAYGNASLAVANPTASVGDNISNGLDQSLALASSKLDSMDIGSLQNMEQGSNRELSNEQLSQIYSDTASTIGNGAKAAIGNLIPDMVNGIADWTERFLHKDSGSLGRVDRWVNVDNEIAQNVANDFRKVAAVGTAMVPVIRTSTSTSLMGQLSQQGIKHNPANILQIGKNADGKILFLETGSANAGLQHIIQRHGADFANRGISQAQIPQAVMAAVTRGKVVGYQGKGTGRPIYEFGFGGQIHRMAVTTGNNGFIVGANPAR